MSFSSERKNGSNAEYETVLCAALLHDIGKFYQRSGFEREKHTKISAAFISNYPTSFDNPHLMDVLVQHHHESKSFAGSFPRDLTDEHERILAYLISRADNYSSSERSEESAGGGYTPDAAMHSLFSEIRIGNDAEIEGNPHRYSYKLGKYLQGDMFPAVNNIITQLDYENHVKQFCAEFSELFPAPYPGMVNTLLYLIRKYLWCVPSDTTKELRDISLADHLQTTCAIAACSYQYHESTGWSENALKNNNLPRFILLGGDLSGIQDYIYGISSIGHGGVAKRLRGRSFKIALLTEMCASHILEKFNLPAACKIMSAGGQFYMLVPNIPDATKMIAELRSEISNYLLESFRGALSISIAHTVLSAENLTRAAFQNVLDEVKLKLEHEKKRKFIDDISAGTLFFDVNYRGEGLCPVCNRNPINGNSDVCNDCHADEEIGRKLPECKYLAVSKYQQSSNNDSDIRMLNYAIKMLSKVPDKKDYLFVWNIKPVSPVENGIEISNADKGYRMLPGQPCGFAPIAGYVPVWGKEDEIKMADYRETLRNSTREGDEHDEADMLRTGMVKSFRALAHAGDGTPRIGVLRADVDNLGLVFSIGLQGNASISRIATLSNMLQAFFSGVLPKIIKEDYANVYIAYAGGDDLMLVGPWQDTISLARCIRQQFSRYTCDNPAFTLSAGIGIFNHHTPVAITAPLTGEMLDEAKNAGRNRLSLFDTVIEWSLYPEITCWSDLFISELLNEQSKMSPGFLYRLLGYQQQALKWYREKNTKSLMYRPHLAYDLGRNYTKDGAPLLLPELHHKLTSLLGSDTEYLWRMLQAPINWAALATRGRRNSK